MTRFLPHANHVKPNVGVWSFVSYIPRNDKRNIHLSLASLNSVIPRPMPCKISRQVLLAFDLNGTPVQLASCSSGRKQTMITNHRITPRGFEEREKRKEKKRREDREGSGHITEETLIHYKQVDSQLEHRVELEFWACYVVAWFHYEFLLQRVT